ncbi:MAG: MscL family protein [Mycobacteriales bacterium]
MDGFKKFLLRGNIVEFAVAIVIGLAFAAVVGAFVDAFITPLVGLLLGSAGDFRGKYFEVSDTRFPIGAFIGELLTFVVTAAAVYFFVVKPVGRAMERFRSEPDADPPVRECAECLSMIPAAARRCSFCTSVQAA